MKSISQCNLKDYFSLSLTKKKQKTWYVCVCVHLHMCVNVFVEYPEPFEMCLPCPSPPTSSEGSRAFKVLLKM